MSTYTVSGTGTHALTAGTVAVHLAITVLPSGAGAGSANPAAHYGVGLLRWSDGTGYWDAVPIAGGPQWLGVPYGATSFGYSVLGAGVVAVTEVFGTSPFAGPLSGLSDVLLSSLSDGQVLEWIAAASQWQNRTPAAGGGGYSKLLLNWSASTDLAGPLALSAGTWTDIPSSSQSFTVDDSTAYIEAHITGGILTTGPGTAGNHVYGCRAMLDGSATFKLDGGGMYNWAAMLHGTGIAYLGILSAASHSLKVQVYSDAACNVYCRASTSANDEFLRYVVWERK